MQTTSTYQFKLIENTDDFSPEPINQNTQAMEGILTGLGNCRIDSGSYVGAGTYGSGNKTALTFDHAPALVLLYQPGGNIWGLLLGGTTRGMLFIGSSVSVLDCAWTADGTGVQWYSGTNAGYQLNSSGTTYHYRAIG